MRIWPRSKAIHTWSIPAIVIGFIVLVFAFVAGPAVPQAADRGIAALVFILISGGLISLATSRSKLDNWMLEQNALVEELRKGYGLSHNQFLYISEATTDAVCCYELADSLPVSASLSEHIQRLLQARLRYANSNFVHSTEHNGWQPSLGDEFSKLEGAKSIAELVTAFVESDYRLNNYEFHYTKANGVERVIKMNMFGTTDGGKLVRFWAVGSNATPYLTAKAELARRENYQEILAGISTCLVTASDELADKAAIECLGRIAELIHADRTMLLWLDDNDAENISIAYSWSRANVDPFDAELSTGQFPNVMRRFPNIMQKIMNNEIVRINSVAALPDEQRSDRQNLQQFALKSILILPLAVGGEVVGGLTFGRLDEETIWSDQTVSEVTVLAELLANYVFRLKSRRKLADALNELESATERLQAENFYLQEEVGREHGFDEIVGESEAILRCLNQVEQVSKTEIPVLILGETGTGKELIARAIHSHSNRGDRPLVKVNCAALPENLIESELFGHERGAFTGAHSRKRGRFDLANGSTLFLDEIGEIPTELQAKLLRVLQEGEFERLGGTKTIRVDVRLLFATNRNLETAVGTGEFRSDLYYRINMFPIDLPPLRERGDDLELLARHFVNLHAQRLGRDVREISSESIAQLRAYNWPGNVRELDGIIQRALISNSGPVVNLAEPLVAPGSGRPKPVIVSSNVVDLKLVEREHIVSVLNETHWKVSGDSGAATRLGIPPSTLRSKMKKLGIERPPSA